jgi:hypothetical protein
MAGAWASVNGSGDSSEARRQAAACGCFSINGPTRTLASKGVIPRRYVAGWRNFQQKFKLLVDAWAHYDNSSEAPVLVEQGSNV